MNYPNAGVPTPEMRPAPKKPFSTALVVLGAAALLIALLVIGGIRAFKSVRTGSAEAIAVGSRFLDSMGRHNYPAAHALFTAQIQASTPATSLQDVETLEEKHYGAYVDHGQPQWNIQNWNGQTSVRLAYPAKFARGTKTVTLVLVQTSKGYQVYDAHYDF